jgi:U3 small nucleolar RNA-associated protein MPP10
LEAENVSKKHWTLMGEATSRIRPHNSLLEEDLEFERVMKAVPIITEEVVSGLEDRIRERILEGRFDDVVRKRPVDDKPFLPSRFFELQDTKSKHSLAQIYEDEYTAAQTGGVAGEDRDGKLKAEHEEITRTWEAISSKLDALSNAHFTPKAVSTPNISARWVLTLLSAHRNDFDYHKRCVDQPRVCFAH